MACIGGYYFCYRRLSITNSEKAAKREVKKQAKRERQNTRYAKPLTARNPAQKTYISNIKNNTLTFGVGPAGVGKTYIPARMFGTQLLYGDISKIYVARPNVSRAHHRMGFLPGTLEDKTAPWLVPIFEGIRESMSPSEFDKFKRSGSIEEVPYEYMQGRTFKNAACIIDEAENLTLDDLYVTLTRQGENLSMVLCGDLHQSVIADSGLGTVVDLVGANNMHNVAVSVFGEEDVVRSEQAKQWVAAFNGCGEWLQTKKMNTFEFRSAPPKFLRKD